MYCASGHGDDWLGALLLAGRVHVKPFPLVGGPLAAVCLFACQPASFGKANK